MFGEKDGYCVIILDKEGAQFGRQLTAKCKEGVFYTFLAGGPTRVETSDKTIIGHMNKKGQWEGGRFDIFKNTALGIVYTKYEKGEEVQDSTCRYYDEEWKTTSGKPLEKGGVAIIGAPGPSGSRPKSGPSCSRPKSGASGSRPNSNLRSEKQRRFSLPQDPLIE